MARVQCSASAVLASCTPVPRTQFLGRYDWEAAARLSADGGSAFSSGHAPTRVLALHPALDLARTRSLAEFNQIVMGLMQVRAGVQCWICICLDTSARPEPNCRAYQMSRSTKASEPEHTHRCRSAGAWARGVWG